MKTFLRLKSLFVCCSMFLCMLMLAAQVYAQDRTITGKVTDSGNGTALPGVNVSVKGTTNRTQTNADGNFTIRVPSANSELEFNYLGYQTQTVAVGAGNTVNVSMVPDATQLGEVVVTALGITREAKSLTYSTQTVGGDKLSETKNVDMINSLQGKVAGLTITRSSSGVSGSSTVLLRGNRSITGNNAPLYITDGVPGSIGLDDGDNIESITVLKGAAAAALYGSAGQNGAIIITTKKGKAGKMTVEYNGGVSFDRADVLQEFQYDYAQGDAGLFVSSSEHSYGPKITGQSVTLWNGNTINLTSQEGRFKDFLQTGVSLNNSLAISAGTDKMQTYFSYGNITANGTVENNKLDRHNFNFKISNKIGNKLSLDTKLTYSYENVDNPPGNSISSMFRAPTSIPLSEMRNYLYTDPTGTEKQSYWKPGSSILQNPYFAMFRNLQNRQSHRITGLLSTNYEFNSWLSLLVRGNLNQSFSNNESKTYSDTYSSLVGSTYRTGEDRGLSSSLDGILSFKRDLTSQFNLSGHVGGSILGSQSRSTSQNANGLNKPDFFIMDNAKNPTVSSDISKSPEVQSLYAAATVAYKNYLYLDMTGRNDWSSALPPGNQSIFYPSVGLTGIVSDMLKMPKWVSYGKARVSVATSGYGGSAYLGQEYYTVGAGGLIATPTIQTLGNYKPEQTSSLEGGLEWRFFNNRLGFDMTLYQTKTTNQLLLVGAPPASTYGQKYINAGLIKNSGIEMLVNFTPLKSRSFNWDALVNFSKNNNKVVRITPSQPTVIIQDDDIVTTKVETGMSFGTLYVKGWQRDSQGRKLVDASGRPLLTPGKTIYAGNFNPNYEASMTNNFSLKNLSLSFQIDYRNGGTAIGGTQALIDADGHSKRSLEGREGGIVVDGYTAAGVKNDKTITSQAYFSAIGDRKPTGEEYTYSLTNMRMREISLGYTIPSSFLSNQKYVKSAKVALTGRNLFFLQRTAPFDPDVQRGRGGTEQNAQPFSRTYGLNLRVTF